MTMSRQTPPKTAEQEDSFSLRELLQVLRKRLWFIALVTVVFTGAAIGYGLAQTPEYEASIKMLVGQEQRTDGPPGDLAGNVQGLQQITQTMVEAINSRPVASAVIQQLNMDMTPEEFLKQHLNVEQVGATQFIQVDYKGQSPEVVQQVANTIGDVFSDQVSEVSTSTNPITATVWEQAEVPENPVSPNFLRIVPLALALALMLGVGMAFLLEYLDDSWRSPEEVEQVSGVPTFGVIPQFSIGRVKKGRG